MRARLGLFDLDFIHLITKNIRNEFLESSMYRKVPSYISSNVLLGSSFIGVNNANTKLTIEVKLFIVVISGKFALTSA